MKIVSRKLILSAAVAAAAVVFAPGSGLPTAPGIAAAATLGPQAGLEADSSAVTLAKKGGPDGLAPGGGGGKGNKGGKGGGHHHHHWGPGVAGAVVLGLGYCAIQAERCEDNYGEDTHRYWRCMRRAGC